MRTGRPPKSLVEYLILDMGYETPCWVWQRSTTSGGYGKRYVLRSGRKRLLGAHVVAYEDANGPVPEGMEIDHLCRVKACVRPDHLEVVTPGVNQQRAKGKLDDGKVATIRSSTLSNRDLAHEFQVDPSIISRVRSGRAWVS